MGEILAIDVKKGMTISLKYGEYLTGMDGHRVKDVPKELVVKKVNVFGNKNNEFAFIYFENGTFATPKNGEKVILIKEETKEKLFFFFFGKRQKCINY